MLDDCERCAVLWLRWRHKLRVDDFLHGSRVWMPLPLETLL